jgi:hypothetical protein
MLSEIWTRDLETQSKCGTATFDLHILRYDAVWSVEWKDRRQMTQVLII